MKHPTLFAADLHGNRYAYQRLFQLAAEHAVETVILGGDLTPKYPVLSFMGRVIIPVAGHLLPPDENGLTYAASLRSLYEQWKQQRSKMEKHFVWLGGYVVHTGIPMEWERLIAEQEVLAKAMTLASVRSDPSLGSVPTFSSEEWTVLERLLNAIPVLGGDIRPHLQAVRAMTLSTADRKVYHDVVATVSRALREVPPAVRQVFDRLLADLLPQQETGSVATIAGCVRLAAEEHPLKRWIELVTGDIHRAESAQLTFLRQILPNMIKAYRKAVPNGRVYLILGNDDLEECIPVVAKLHEQGYVTNVDRVPVDVGNIRIVGFPFVRCSNGRFYSAWERDEEDIFTALSHLARSCEGKRTIFVVHSPPANTSLDLSFDGSIGSQGVRSWIERKQKYLVLSGHVHEAPFVNGGTWKTTVNGTLCMQPGGFHDQGVCAVLFDAEDPAHAEWIHPQKRPS